MEEGRRRRLQNRILDAAADEGPMSERAAKVIAEAVTNDETLDMMGELGDFALESETNAVLMLGMSVSACVYMGLAPEKIADLVVHQITRAMGEHG